MVYTEPTPEHLRPTIDQLRRMEHEARVKDGLRKKTVEVCGLWVIEESVARATGKKPGFHVKITGAACDVDEAVETLRENGNLCDVHAHEV